MGTGGTLAVARFAAWLHERTCGQPARVLTPLELACLPPLTNSGVVLFSAGLKHPDALAALELLGSTRFRPAVVVTFRDPATLADLVSPDLCVITLPPLEIREGFLATTSVLVMMAAVFRSYMGHDTLPLELPIPDVEMPAAVAGRLLVLTTPELAPVATDLETRFHELGLAPVQVTDYRNLAHGRHVGLARHAADTTVIGLVSEPLTKLAETTIAVLSKGGLRPIAWRARQEGPLAVLELVQASMALAGQVAANQNVTVSRPGAAPFGRRLYHLGVKRLVPTAGDGPVERKLVALASGATDHSARDTYVEALKSWLEGLGRQRFAAVVLDYDGTVCPTGARTELPPEPVRDAISRVLDAGGTVGFASGRGKSLHADLRAWVDTKAWSRVTVGLYNGGWVGTLTDDLPDFSAPSGVIEAAHARLKEIPAAAGLVLEARMSQLTVTVGPGAFAVTGRLGALITSALSRSPSIPVKVVSSGHSVDVVPNEVTKVAVAEEVGAIRGRPVLSIGDQGDVGGNDFELLAETQWSLTVDRCSADPTRCWYLDSQGRSGPDLTTAYLNAINVEPDGLFSIDWPVA